MPSHNPYSKLATDIDLITIARDLLLQLPVEVIIKHQWVKGHFKGGKELQHELNYIADELTTDFNAMDRRTNRKPPVLPPMYEAEQLIDNYIVTSRLAMMVTAVLHDDHLQLHICSTLLHCVLVSDCPLVGIYLCTEKNL